MFTWYTEDNWSHAIVWSFLIGICKKMRSWLKKREFSCFYEILKVFGRYMSFLACRRLVLSHGKMEHISQAMYTKWIFKEKVQVHKYKVAEHDLEIQLSRTLENGFLKRFTKCVLLYCFSSSSSRYVEIEVIANEKYGKCVVKRKRTQKLKFCMLPMLQDVHQKVNNPICRDRREN